MYFFACGFAIGDPMWEKKNNFNFNVVIFCTPTTNLGAFRDWCKTDFVTVTRPLS